MSFLGENGGPTAPFGLFWTPLEVFLEAFWGLMGAKKVAFRWGTLNRPVQERVLSQPQRNSLPGARVPLVVCPPVL